MLGGNPALRRLQRTTDGQFVDEHDRSTYGGIAKKSIFLVVLTFITAVASFFGVFFFVNWDYHFGIILGVLIGAGVVSFIMSMLAIFNPNATKVCGTIYALLQGFVLGFTALMVTSVGYGGEVLAALLATVGTFLVMMILYATGVIRVGSGFRKFIISAVIGMVLINLIMFLVALLTPGNAMWDLFFGNSFIAIAISVVMVILASLMILLDLNRMTAIVQAGLDKRYEWVAAFGLLITLIWLYMEFLRLFIRIASRRR